MSNPQDFVTDAEWKPTNAEIWGKVNLKNAKGNRNSFLAFSKVAWSDVNFTTVKERTEFMEIAN